jgi:hydrogenase-1 operon protein HyaF
MKAGFWVAPEGEETAVALHPIEPDAPLAGKRPAFLATLEADALIRRCPETAGLLPRLVAALAQQRAGERGKLFDITDWSAEERKLIGEALGEGEVGGVAALPNGVTAQIQETVFAGLWRVRFADAQGVEIGDYLEVGALPEVVREALRGAAVDFVPGVPPDEAMNVMPVLAELRERMKQCRPGDPAHVVNFTLLPMTPADMAFLQTTLGVGPVKLVSRGYGCARVTSTAARNVWSVQFTNSMDTVVLDTVEVVETPAAVSAADEDFADSSGRLAEVEDAYFK